MRIEITRSKVYPSRPRPGPAWSWLYEAQGPDTITVGERELPRRFDNRSIVTLRGVLRKAYGPDVELVETWKGVSGRGVHERG